METVSAAVLLAALGHESRLAIFRLLVEAGPEGMNVSSIAEKLGLPGATLSFHLSHLSRVGLIRGERESRFIHYSAEYETVLGVWRELMQADGWANLLVVAHDAVNRIILSHVVGASLEGLSAFEQEPACINIIDIDVEAGQVERAFIRAANLAAYNLAAHANHHTVMERISAQFKVG